MDRQTEDEGEPIWRGIGGREAFPGTTLDGMTAG